MHYLWLIIAVVAETLGTTAVQASHQFTRLWPSVIVVVSYSVAFYFLSLSLKAIPVGVAYAIWAGLGVVLITLVGWLALGQKLDSAAVAGMGLIVAGVAVINLFSSAGGH